jgi:hypothetical protein
MVTGLTNLIQTYELSAELKDVCVCVCISLCCGQVKEVLYIMLTAQKKVRVGDESLDCIPQGFEMEFTVSYHDNCGSPFDATKSSIRLRTNRFDLAQLRSGEVNNSLIVNLLNEGQTLLKVWDDLTPQHAADYVKLSVRNVIFPEKAKQLLHTVSGSSLLL